MDALTPDSNCLAVEFDGPASDEEGGSSELRIIS
ncbi:hypothetical protein A2U01_0097629, partial [Trifolium medium]|nr:hypothetical protein [Trifolium medium]